jgi:plastocyanin
MARTSRVAGLALAAALCGGTRPSLAQEKVKEQDKHSAGARGGPTWAEFQQLQNEVREQRQLIIQLMQTEQQRYDVLLRLIQGQGTAGGTAATPASPGTPDPDKSKTALAGAVATRAAEGRNGALEGKVKVPGGDTSDLYVYVDYRGPVARGRSLEIKQENKQFVPRVAVVPVGATVSFPNVDPVFHNVFSNSPRNSFDLGSYRSGDKPRSAVFNAPGVVDIFCNMHQRMSAHVLVVPSKHYARVKPDGSFRIDGVPSGARNVVAWSPSLKPSQQKVEVQGNATTRVSFDMQYTDQKIHSNKSGQPYGSYKE